VASSLKREAQGNVKRDPVKGYWKKKTGQQDHRPPSGQEKRHKKKGKKKSQLGPKPVNGEITRKRGPIIGKG